MVAPAIITAGSGVAARWLTALDVPFREAASPTIGNRDAEPGGGAALSVQVTFGEGDARHYELQTLRDVLEMVLDMGRSAGRLERAMEVLGEGERRLTTMIPKSSASSPRVAALVSLEPLVLAGLWIPDMIARAGAVAVGVGAGDPDRQIADSELEELSPDVLIMISGEVRPEAMRKRARAMAADGRWARLTAIRQGRVLFFDGSRHFLEPGPGIYETIARFGVHLHALHRT